MAIDYNNIYKQAAKNGGWSKAKPDDETSWGDMYLNLISELNGDENILDIGTAEGNRFLMIANHIASGIGIDVVSEMVDLAKKNEKLYPNISFIVMDSDKLEFDDNLFDIITARHASFDLPEAYRVLKKNGLVITQQIYESDKKNLKEAFGRGQDWGVNPGTRLERYKQEALDQGFEIIDEMVSDQPYIFPSKQELLEYLKFTPTIYDFNEESDALLLDGFIRENQTSEGIVSNSSRFLLKLRKL